MTLLLDSVILIDHFNNIPAATAYLRMVHGGAAISVITRAEVLAGFDEAGTVLALPLLDIFPVLDITKQVADLAAKLRREHRWKLPDTLQAAVAQTHNLKLATRNTKDFSPERHPFVTIPYTLEK
ncbi:MAG: PIN domain-containing protein [Bryobacteraceae bacterium]|nr:PIN domain-containing protein [Bryobacteraceae bacterium]